MNLRQIKLFIARKVQYLLQEKFNTQICICTFFCDMLSPCSSQTAQSGCVEGGYCVSSMALHVKENV